VTERIGSPRCSSASSAASCSPGTGAVDVDQVLRARVAGPERASVPRSARRRRAHSRLPLPGTLRRAVELDGRFADLDLGFVDGVVMALAERMRVPILTFDLEHFRATRRTRGFWRLVVDERRYAEATRR